MLNEQKRSRLEALRQRASEQALTAREQTELAVLIQEIEAAEAAYLRPATAKLRHERERLEAQNHALLALAQRKQDLVEKLRATLVEAATERRKIDAELSHIIGVEARVEVGHSG